MKINKEVLKGALKKLKPALTSNHVVASAGVVIFEEGMIKAYDGEVAIHLPLEGMEIDCNIPSDALIPLVDKFNGVEVEMEYKKRTLHLKCGRSKVKLTSVKVEGLDITDKIYSKRAVWETLPDDFLEALSMCAISASENISHGILCSIKIRGDTMISSDLHRLTHYTMEGEVPWKGTIYLPSFKIEDIIAFKPEEIFIDGESMFHFKTGGGDVISISTIAKGTFPQTVEILKVEGGQLILPQEELMMAIERIEILASTLSINQSNWHRLHIEIGDGRLKCSGESKKGEIEEEMRISDKKAKLDFWINSAFLKRILPVCDLVVNGEKKILFKGEKFKHVICKLG